MKTTFFLSAVLLAAACGGGNSDPDANLSHPDARRAPDAMPVLTCAVEAAFNTVAPDPATDSAVFQTTVGTPARDVLFFQFGVVGTGVNPDFLLLDIPFPAPGGDLNTALELVQACTGAPIDYCMRILTDLDDQGNFGQLLYPDTGTMTITEAAGTGGNFTLSMTNATFNHYDANTGMPIADGCTTDVTAWGPVTYTVQAGFAPEQGLKRPIKLPKIAPRF